MDPHKPIHREADIRPDPCVPPFTLRKFVCWLTWSGAFLTLLFRVGHWVSDLANVAPPAVAVLFLFVGVVLAAQIVVLRTIVNPLTRVPKS